MKIALIDFLSWLSKSFSNSGDVSGRRLTAFSVNAMYLFARGWYVIHCTDIAYQLYGCILDSLYVLLLFGIVTMQQITELKNGTTIKEHKKETTSETTTQTTQP